jgi:hypothetical protein
VLLGRLTTNPSRDRWDGISSMPLACGPGENHPAGADPDLDKIRAAERTPVAIADNRVDTARPSSWTYKPKNSDVRVEALYLPHAGNASRPPGVRPNRRSDQRSCAHDGVPERATRGAHGRTTCEATGPREYGEISSCSPRWAACAGRSRRRERRGWPNSHRSSRSFSSCSARSNPLSYRTEVQDASELDDRGRG